MDITDFCEFIATDKVRCRAFMEAIDAQDLMRAEALIADAVNRLNVEIGRAWTATGRKIRHDQAVATISLLGSKAARASEAGVYEAVPQALWCAALLDRL